MGVTKQVTVDELIEKLNNLKKENLGSGNWPVILQKDDEGNGYRPMYCVEKTNYLEDDYGDNTTLSDEELDEYDPDGLSEDVFVLS